MTTDDQKKKTSRIATTTLFIGICASVAGIAYLGAYQIYWDSLRTNNIAGNLMGIFWMAWFFLSVITFFAFLSTIIWIALSKGKLRGFAEAICAFIAVFFIAGLVMPTLGVMHSRHYRSLAGRVAWEYLEEYKSTQTDKGDNPTPSLADYNVEILEDYDTSTYETKKVEVVYTLKEDSERASAPQQFSVLLNFETGEKSIKADDSVKE